jgi:hypothetical protein
MWGKEKTPPRDSGEEFLVKRGSEGLRGVLKG